MDYTPTTEFYMWGGYSYAVGDPEHFDTLEDACRAYVDRYESNGIRMIDGLLYPCWGDADDDAIVITTEHDGWTRAQVFAIGRG